MAVAAAWLALLTATPGLADDQASSRPSGRAVDFASEVYPIFEQRCHACHGASQQMGEFRLDSGPAALVGGVSGVNIVPGDAGASALVQRIAGTGNLNAMPMTGERLSDDQVSLVRHWIDQGAEWPAGVGVDSRTPLRHWAYRLPERPVAPAVRSAGMQRNPIDSFILARLEQEGLGFNPPAGKAALVRRVSLDLTGLPPSVEEVDRFLEDASPGAYGRLVERKLKSPHFGEHWARYWLDLARYADTNGYESDEPRTMWAYRDWVVDAFNRNLRFDQFTVEQLAGDLLPDPTVAQRVATGFHRNTMLTNEAGSKDDEFYDAAVKDRVDTTATVWLGSTVGCAQCHDHKYDPFRQSEYYQLYAIFDNTADSAIKISEQMDVFKGDSDELRRRTAEVDAAKGILETPTVELERAQREWESRTSGNLARWEGAWRMLKPDPATAVGRGNLQVRPDGSVALEEAGDDPTTVELNFDLEETVLTGLRIEALPGAGLPGTAAGEDAAGAFSVAEIAVEAWTPKRLAGQADLRGVQPKWGNWHAIGPFRVGSRDEALQTAFPPETLVDLSATYENGHLAWLERKDWSDGLVHYLGYIPDDSESNCASYAYRTVEVPESTTVQVSMGSLKGLKVWLNGQPVLSADPTRSIGPDQERVTLDLRRGTNEVLVKLSNDQGPYGFYFAPYFGHEMGARLKVTRAAADHGGWGPVDLAAVLDGQARTAWKPGPQKTRGESRSRATLRFERPAALPAGSLLRVRLVETSPEGARPGRARFRFSATSLAEAQLAAMQETPAAVRAVLETSPGGRSDLDEERLAVFYRSIAPELDRQRRVHAELKSSLEDFRARHTTTTLVMRELDEPRKTHVQRRGNFLDLGERVRPGVPGVLVPGDPPEVGNRLELARWLTGGENPLTARVRVNQIWGRLFGRGLVHTAEDFGSQGDRPSHPELLDWLAVEFVRLGWDTQALLRTILTSRAYRQDSSVAPAKLEKDPQNILLSRGARFRVGAESVRDIALASSGQLVPRVGGPTVFPPQPSEVFGEHYIEGGFKDWPTSEGSDRYRRGLYTFYKRTVVYPAFMNFDGPDRTVCTVNRSLSNTPLQALNTLNDPAFVDAAASLAARMLSERGRTDSDRISHGFRAVLARRPQAAELERLVALLDRMAETYAESEEAATLLVSDELRGPAPDLPSARFAPWVMLANVLLNLDETYTRE